MLKPARIRILPILIFIAVLFLGFRINHFIAILSGAVNSDMFLQKADAAADPKNPAPTSATPAAPTPASATPGAPAAPTSAPATPEAAATTPASSTTPEAAAITPPAEASGAAPAGASGENAAKAEGGGEGEKEKRTRTPEQVLEELKIKPKIYEPQPDDLAAVDQKILEELKALKVEVQEKKQALDEREVLIQVTEKRVDEKISELQALKNQIEAILGKLDQEQKDKILSLVKVYEAMKPKDAARIFDNLEMDVLIEVADHMKEARLAPIMAKMNDGKAKSLTRLMAERKKFSG